MNTMPDACALPSDSCPLFPPATRTGALARIGLISNANSGCNRLHLGGVHRILSRHAAHADARADGVDAVLQRLDGDLGALARLAGDTLDLHLAVVDLRHFELQQATQQVAMVAADDDLRAAAGAAHFQDVDANLVVGAVALALHLLALG